jgi:MFS family permease
MDIRPLRESPAFRRLWVGLFVSMVGGTMTGFAVTLQVFEITGSSAAVGMLGLVSVVPTIALGLLGSSFADAVDRRKLVLCTNVSLAMVSVLFAMQAFMGLRQLWLLYVLRAVQSMIGAVDAPARRTLATSLLPANRQSAAASLSQFAGMTSVTVGPMIAGVVTAASGLRFCYLVDAISYAAALLGVLGLPAMRPRGGAGGKPGPRAVLEGLAYIRRTPVLAGVFAADLIACVLAMPVALFPQINAEHFGGSPRTLGLLTAAIAFGGVLGSALSGPVGHTSRQGRAMLFMVALWGAALCGFGLSGVLWLSLLTLVVAGSADALSVVLRATIVQTTVPDEYRGRILGVDYVVGLGGPQLGQVRSGLVAAASTPTIAAVSGGLSCLVGVGALAAGLPALVGFRGVTADARPDDDDADADGATTVATDVSVAVATGDVEA